MVWFSVRWIHEEVVVARRFGDFGGVVVFFDLCAGVCLDGE